MDVNEIFDELSAEGYSEENAVFVIDAETRTISVPASESLFGVTGDKDVERKYFQCPKIVGDNIDLSQHQIYIAYVFTSSQNNTSFPDSGEGLYHCDDVAVDGDNITFSWLLSGNALANQGFIAFKVMAKKSDGENLATKWNTAPAYGTVLLTVPDGEDIAEQYPDVINEILDRLDALEEGGGGTGGTVSVEVESTTTGEPGTNAQVTNSGTSQNVKLNFTIPRGEKGDKGDKGDTGDTGPAGQDGKQGPAGESGIAPRQQMLSTDTTVTLEPNKLYVFPEMASLTITLGTPSDTNVANEYHFFFTSGDTATTLTLNDVLSDAYSIEANMKYEVSILEGVAYIKGVAVNAS